jgi:hypothetical protein
MEIKEPKTIEQLIQERQPVKVRKPRKDDNTREYVDKIHDATGWDKRAIYFQVPHNRLKEALEYCLHYTDVKARNFKLKEFINLSKQ